MLSLNYYRMIVVSSFKEFPSSRTKQIFYLYSIVEFVQDVASRGLGLVYNLSDPTSQNDLANSLLDQLMGGKRKVNKVNEDTELFAEGMLGKTPTG